MFCKSKEDFIKAGIIDENGKFLNSLSFLDITGGQEQCIVHSWVGSYYFTKGIYADFVSYRIFDEDCMLVHPKDLEKMDYELAEYSYEKDKKLKDVMLGELMENIEKWNLTDVDRSYLKDPKTTGDLIKISIQCKPIDSREDYVIFMPENWFHNWFDC